MNERTYDSGYSKVSKRIALFVISAVASGIIGIYVKRFFDKEIDVKITAEQTHSVEYIKSAGGAFTGVPKKNKFGVDMYDQDIIVRNTGNLPLKQFFVAASLGDTRGRLGRGSFGEPWVPPSQTVRCEPMPPSAQDATLQGVGTWWRVAWNCNLLNPGEEVRLKIWDGVDKVEYFTVTVRAEGVTQEKGFAFVENR